MQRCEVPLVPRHSFSLWNRYDFTDKLGAGLGLIARSKSYASLSNNVKLPGYARVDAAVFYQLTKNVDAQLNIENLFGADYFPTAHNDNNIAPGAPFTVKGASPSPEASAESSAESSAEATAEASTAASAAPSAAPSSAAPAADQAAAEESSGTFPFYLIIVVGALVGIERAIPANPLA